jgi:helicase MOV-10
MPRNCPNILASGVCTDALCRLEHNIRTCDACNYVANNVSDYNAHIKSKKHQRAMARGRPNQSYYCRVCQCPVESDVWEQHIAGKKHLRQAQNPNIEPTFTFPTETHTFCGICQISILNHLWGEHLSCGRHTRSQRYAVFKTAQEDSEKDKNGVVVDGDSDFGILEPTVGASGVTVSLRISCTVPLAKIVMVSAKLSADLGSQRRRVASP